MIHILVIQMSSILGNKETNFDKVDKLLKPHIGCNFDLIILPELFATGWDCDIYSNVAESFGNSKICNYISKIAKDMQSNVIGGSFARLCDDGNIRNTCPFFDRKGNLVTHYDKMHLYSYLGDTENLNSVAGNNPVIANSDVGRIGLSICYDIRFPEIYRAYAYGGSDLLVNVAAWPKTRKLAWDSLSAARAIENQSFAVFVSQCGEIKNGIYNLGHSKILSPLGEVISEADIKEMTISATIDLAEMTDLRNNVKTLQDKHSCYKLENE